MTGTEARPRGRPRQAAADESEMRSRIVAAARQLFLRDGVEAVSMRNLASEVGCTPMWLYRFFGSKQEILAQVWDVFFDELFARLQKIKAASPKVRLEKLALGYFEYWMEHPERFMIVFLQRDLEPGGTRRYVEASDTTRRFDLFTQVVEQAKASGEIAGPDATAIAQGLLCIVQGLAVNLITIGEYPWHDATALSQLTVRSYLAGLQSGVDVPPGNMSATAARERRP